MKNVTKLMVIAMGSVLLMSASIVRQTTAWVAPKEANLLVNPLKGNAAATKEGKNLYNQYCTVCHGYTGKGDGTAGIALNPRPADHSSAKIQSQTDGAIYWKLMTGKPPMVSYKAVLKEEQRWQLVNYIRELGQPVAKKK